MTRGAHRFVGIGAAVTIDAHTKTVVKIGNTAEMRMMMMMYLRERD